MQFSTNDSSHLENMLDPKGSGPPGCYPPQLGITVPATTATIQVPFSGPNAPLGGSPAVPIDPARLVGVQWQFTTAAGADSSCAVDITIDNVRFF